MRRGCDYSFSLCRDREDQRAPLAVEVRSFCFLAGPPLLLCKGAVYQEELQLVLWGVWAKSPQVSMSTDDMDRA